MQRQIVIDTVSILGFNTPCAHHCLYCLMGKQKAPAVSFARMARVAERFQDWRDERQIGELKVHSGPSFSHNFDLDTTADLARLLSRLGLMEGFGVLLMGGLPIRPQDDMRNWLQDRQALGLKSLVPSLAGVGKTHDHYNRRRGDFEFLIDTLRTGAELGLEAHQRLFLTKRTLPQIERLIETLDSVPIKVLSRSLCPFYYRGLSDQLEEERITEEVRDGLPPQLAALRHADDPWLSEREWIDHVKNEDPTKPDVVRLILHLDASNIGKIETMPVEEIFKDLEHRTRVAYAAVPSRQELAKHVGDPSNTRIYVHREDVERLWLDRYLRDHPIKFERELTYFH
ncbi:MAG: hypothetical protein ACLQFI_10995 [Methylocella sp.]